MTSIMKVAQTGEAILSLVAAPVAAEEITQPWLSQLIHAMFLTMQARQGVGIAAPQVYWSKRIIIVASRPNVRYPDAPEMQPIVMINPEITQQSSEENLGEEGCLSVPDTRGQVLRATHIDVRYLDEQAQLQHIQLSGFPARIVQHEIDHLNGVLFTDRL